MLFRSLAGLEAVTREDLMKLTAADVLAAQGREASQTESGLET